VASITRAAGTAVAKPTDPARSGYEFSGWFDAATGGVKYAWPHALAASVTMHAQWTAIAYTVAYNKNAADATGTTASSSHVYGTPKVLALNGFARAGYAFAGWNVRMDGGGTSYADGASVHSLSSTKGATVTLYAQWTPVSYAITYNLNGGTNGANPETYTIEDAAIPLADPARAGFTFGGWHDNAEFSGAPVTGIPTGSTGDKTFYARWLADVPANISVWVNEDGDILASNTEVALSKSGADGKDDSFTATVSGVYSGIQWRLYGVPVPGNRGTAWSIDINAADFINGSYYLEVTVTKAQIPYSTSIHFTVAD
jgi:uncharacterized repeat protein (TIGR02543 family)